MFHTEKTSINSMTQMLMLHWHWFFFTIIEVQFYEQMHSMLCFSDTLTFLLKLRKITTKEFLEERQWFPSIFRRRPPTSPSNEPLHQHHYLCSVEWQKLTTYPFICVKVIYFNCLFIFSSLLGLCIHLFIFLSFFLTFDPQLFNLFCSPAY